MKTVGALILLVSLGLVVLVSIGAIGDMTNQATNSGDMSVVGVISSVGAMANPIFLVFGFLILIVGASIAIDAFR